MVFPFKVIPLECIFPSFRAMLLCNAERIILGRYGHLDDVNAFKTGPFDDLIEEKKESLMDKIMWIEKLFQYGNGLLGQ